MGKKIKKNHKYEDMALGEILEDARLEKRLTRAKLAELANVSINSLPKWERAGFEDGKYPPLPKLANLCRVLEIDPRMVFDAKDVLDEEVAIEEKVVSPDDEEFYFYRYFSFVENFRTELDKNLQWNVSVENILELNEKLSKLQKAVEWKVGDKLETIGNILREEYDRSVDQEFLEEHPMPAAIAENEFWSHYYEEDPENPGQFRRNAQWHEMWMEDPHNSGHYVKKSLYRKWLKENGPDQNDPDRPISNHPKAVSAASNQTQSKKGKASDE